MSGSVFDVCGPLPSGVTVLEASAGTGKTFTIAALAARYVADGVPLRNLLLVTFTRMATGELRDRVRERLVTAERGLTAALEGAPPPADDSVLGLLAQGPAQVVATRRHRLAEALSDFDAATIATIHQFCDHILNGLGVVGDVERDATFLEDVGDLVDEVIDDLYVRRFHSDTEPPELSRQEALEVGRLAVRHPDAVLRPDGAGDGAAAMRVRLAHAVRAEVEERKRRAGVMTYDDLLTRLRDTLVDPQRGPAACGRLRARYRVALVDEFQDTDPIQWEILQRVFAHGRSTLVLIGDPKQAIYAFRGADVYAYLRAARNAASRATLGTNWRSDQGLIDAYDALLSDAQLGHPEIRYRRVQATADHREPRLTGGPVPAPLRVRILPRRDLPSVRGGTAPTGPARERIAADVAADLARLLSSPARIETRRGDGSVERTAVQPGHVAVLVRLNRDAALVRDALAAVGVPAVTAGGGSVFGTEAAVHWLRLLHALRRPTSPTRVRAAALTPFLGWSAADVAAADDDAWERVHATLHRWADVLARRGVAALQETVTLTARLPQRVLAVQGGERLLTDLRHLGELLHAAASGERLGPAALAAWLQQRMRETGEEAEAEERSRRLESDAEAVQVLTIHRSKGLEFPIVYAPFLWNPAWIPRTAFPRFHDPDHADTRTIDLTATSAATRSRYVGEERGEDLRLLYVALTRAQHQAVLWWVGTKPSCDGALSRLLVDRRPDGSVPPSGSRVPSDAEMLGLLERLAERAPGRISVEVADFAGVPGTYRSDRRLPADLGVECFDRRLDVTWRRSSYSGITSGHRDGPRVGSEPELAVIEDEGLPPVVGTADGSDEADVAARPAGAPDAVGASSARPARGERDLRRLGLPLAAMPGGTHVGTFVHGVLERVDFAAPDLPGALVEAVEEERRWRPVDVGPQATLVAGLQAAIETPLDPLVGDVALRDVSRTDRVDELWFELPLVGGDEARGGDPLVDLDGIAAVLRRHIRRGSLLHGYAEHLDDPALRRQLRGYLVGSLDLVFRVGCGGDARYAVVDYKTNWLGAPGEPLTAWHYRPAALEAAMHRGHYPLQALLYCVALHRFLRWRVPGYTPERNLAGALYLFVRGMTGRDTPIVDGRRCGVFAWPAAPALIEDLSDLFEQGTEVPA